MVVMVGLGQVAQERSTQCAQRREEATVAIRGSRTVKGAEQQLAVRLKTVKYAARGSRRLRGKAR